jgi:hypothetical protein
MIKWIKESYGSLIDLVGFIVGHTSDHGADIAIRALPILSPMPNAIGMYYVSMHTLGFGHWQALAFALAIEFALFGLFEVALMMFDGTQADERRYRWPFRLAVTVAVVVMALIIIVVFRLETAHPILAVLPLFSAAGAVALALRRWHARNMNKVESNDELTDELYAKLEALQTDNENFLNQSRQLQISVRQYQTDSENFRTESNELRTQLEQLQKELDKVQRDSEQFSLDSVLGRLDEGKREKLLKLLDVVENNRITGPADIVKVSDFNKTDAYTFWPIAQATRIIYLNGDGAYHKAKG